MEGVGTAGEYRIFRSDLAAFEKKQTPKHRNYLGEKSLLLYPIENVKYKIKVPSWAMQHFISK